MHYWHIHVYMYYHIIHTTFLRKVSMKKYWTVSQRARRRAGLKQLFALEIIASLVFALSMIVANTEMNSYFEYMLVSALWCFGTPLGIIALIHLFLGIDAATQERQAQAQKKWGWFSIQSSSRAPLTPPQKELRGNFFVTNFLLSRL